MSRRLRELSKPGPIACVNKRAPGLNQAIGRDDERPYAVRIPVRRMEGARIGIVTVSDRASEGIYEDLSGPEIHRILEDILITKWTHIKRIIPDEREVIEQIEVIKITPQKYAGEAISPLIQDPWRTIPCQGTGECIVEFEDQNFSRDSIYYVRALQNPTPAINGSILSNRDSFELCKGSFKTNLTDNCLSMTKERAWSSPIYVNKP